MMKWIMIDPIGGIKMTLIPMVALDNTSNRLWLAALPILPELRFWFIGTIKQLEEEFEQRELYSHDLEFSSICIQVVPGFLSWVFLVAVFTSIFGRMCGHLFWIHGRGETFYANLKPMMDRRENQWADRWPFLGTRKRKWWNLLCQIPNGWNWKSKITFSGYMEISRPVGIASRSRDTSPPLVGLSTLIFLENFDYFDPPHQTINNILCHHLPRWEKRGELESCRFCRRGSRRGAEWRWRAPKHDHDKILITMIGSW